MADPKQVKADNEFSARILNRLERAFSILEQALSEELVAGAIAEIRDALVS